MPTFLSMCQGGMLRDATRVTNRARPRTRLFVGLQRHRRDRIRPVARLALVLENRRDVFGERRYGRRLSRKRCGQSQEAQRAHRPNHDPADDTISHLSPPKCRLASQAQRCDRILAVGECTSPVTGCHSSKALMATITYANMAADPSAFIATRLSPPILGQFPKNKALQVVGLGDTQQDRDGRVPACAFRRP